MTCAVVVPARYASTRLPGKPLALLAGEPMIVHVLRRCASSTADVVFAAVDDERVAAAVNDAGFTAVMTDPSHPSGSDRVMEVARQERLGDDDVVVNVQGDEPMIPVANINALIRLMQTTPSVQMATLSEPLDSATQANPNVVKLVCDARGDALYFSRAPIPYARDTGRDPAARRHVGVYAFRVGALRAFTIMGESSLERTERLEQLRWLEAGHAIRVLEAPEPSPPGVDTAEDLARVADALRRHPSPGTPDT